MTNEQAIQLLIEATKNLHATREQHQAILLALETLKKTIDALKHKQET